MNDQDNSESFDVMKKFEAGYFFYSEGNIDKAIECWKDISPDDDPKAYVYAQHYLAQFYAERNDMKQARVHWSNISRDSRDDIYANAQFNLGSSWYQEKDFDQAIFYWKNVPKIESNMHFYIEAQFNLAVFYFQKGDVKQAQLHCLNIPKIDDDRYNFAQINLGNSYAQQGNMEKALFHWRNVFRRDGEEYCLAQFSLASFYAQHRDIGQARIHWNNISKGNLKLYAIAQFNLGTSFLEEGNIQEAQLHLSCVPKIDDERNIYAKAQFNLASIFNEEGNLKQAQIHWGNIPEKIEEQNIYLQAQINLANSFNKEGNVKQARIHWNNIPNEKNKNNTYAKAQFNLGRSFNREGNFKQARIHLNNVLKNNLDSTYAQAQFYLGSILQEERNFHQVEEYWKEIIHYPIKFDNGNYRSDLITYNMKKIATFFQINRSKVQHLIPSMILLYIEDIQEHVENILTSLRINSSDLMSEDIQDQQLYFEKVEKQFAHYTRVEIAELIIKNGSFHLGVANHMNDPQEGKVLLNEWKIPLNYNNNLRAFLTSFTFNENSLNQFRLYGKKDNVDGSGVSLVIKNNFFELMFDPGKHVNMALLSVNEDDQKNISKNIKNKKRLSNKLPLYRCIYMYPGMKYINIAHRNELSFFLDKDDNVNINKKWKVYIEKMNEIRSNVTNELDNITKTIKEVITLIEKDGIVEQNKIYEVIATTLLPIIYLTKHAAFEEEAECRIVYITSQDDEVIQKDRDRVYVEYAINLADQYQQEERSQNYLERIYLGPKADPSAELNLKKCWIDKMREKGMTNNDIKIPTIKKSDMPLA